MAALAMNHTAQHPTTFVRLDPCANNHRPILRFCAHSLTLHVGQSGSYSPIVTVSGSWGIFRLMLSDTQFGSAVNHEIGLSS